MQEGNETQGNLLRIQDAAAEVSLTPRSVRYYEELGLLKPAARSEGDYRLYDESDLERLRFIKALRDDAGFSLAEIRQLLEDEDARQRGHEAFAATQDPAERRALLDDRIARIDGQIAILRGKIGKLQAMVEDAERRRAKNVEKLASIEAEQPALAGSEGTRR